MPPFSLLLLLAAVYFVQSALYSGAAEASAEQERSSVGPMSTEERRKLKYVKFLYKYFRTRQVNRSVDWRTPNSTLAKKFDWGATLHSALQSTLHSNPMFATPSWFATTARSATTARGWSACRSATWSEKYNPDCGVQSGV